MYRRTTAASAGRRGLERVEGQAWMRWSAGRERHRARRGSGSGRNAALVAFCSVKKLHHHRRRSVRPRAGTDPSAPRRSRRAEVGPGRSGTSPDLMQASARRARQLPAAAEAPRLRRRCALACTRLGRGRPLYMPGAVGLAEPRTGRGATLAFAVRATFGRGGCRRERSASCSSRCPTDEQDPDPATRCVHIPRPRQGASSTARPRYEITLDDDPAFADAARSRPAAGRCSQILIDGTPVGRLSSGGWTVRAPGRPTRRVTSRAPDLFSRLERTAPRSSPSRSDSPAPFADGGYFQDGRSRESSWSPLSGAVSAVRDRRGAARRRLVRGRAGSAPAWACLRPVVAGVAAPVHLDLATPSPTAAVQPLLHRIAMTARGPAPEEIIAGAVLVAPLRPVANSFPGRGRRRLRPSSWISSWRGESGTGCARPPPRFADLRSRLGAGHHGGDCERVFAAVTLDMSSTALLRSARARSTCLRGSAPASHLDPQRATQSPRRW